MRRMLFNRLPAVSLALVVVSLVAPAGVVANPAPLHAVGRTPVPKGQTRVRMLSETVVMDISYDPRGNAQDSADQLNASPYCGHIKATFEFDAPAPEKLVVGFPLGRLLEGGWFAGPVNDFRCSVGGQAVTHEVDEVRQSDKILEVWATWEVAFPKGRTRVDIAYSVPSEAYLPWTDPSFWYILSTGRYWAGDISRAVISLGVSGCDGSPMPLRPEDVLEPTTRGWCIDGGRLLWDFKDIEPDFDVEATVKPLPFLDAIARVLRAARGAEPSGMVKGMDAAQAGYFVTRFLTSPDDEEWTKLGITQQDTDALWELGLAQCKRALSSSDDDGLHVAYLSLLQTWHDTDKEPSLLRDYLAEEVWLWTVWRGVRVPYEAEKTVIIEKAIRLCAFRGERAIPGVVNALRQLSIGVKEVGQEVDWTRDFSGLPADRLMKAQITLSSALTSATTASAPGPSPAGDRAGLPTLLAVGVIVAICAAVVVAKARARARSSPAHRDGGDLPGEGSHP